MPYEIADIDVWVSEIDNQAGGLAGVLEELRGGDINLEFVVGRRQPDKPGYGLVFIAPVKGARQINTAKKAGFKKAETMHSVRVTGPDKAGLGASMSSAIAAVGVNLRGITAASIGRKCLVYFAFDSKEDAKLGKRELRKLLK